MNLKQCSVINNSSSTHYRLYIDSYFMAQMPIYRFIDSKYKLRSFINDLTIVILTLPKIACRIQFMAILSPPSFLGNTPWGNRAI